jgi:hypothetical protein
MYASHYIDIYEADRGCGACYSGTTTTGHARCGMHGLLDRYGVWSLIIPRMESCDDWSTSFVDNHLHAISLADANVLYDFMSCMAAVWPAFGVDIIYWPLIQV